MIGDHAAVVDRDEGESGSADVIEIPILALPLLLLLLLLLLCYCKPLSELFSHADPWRERSPVNQRAAQARR